MKASRGQFAYLSIFILVILLFVLPASEQAQNSQQAPATTPSTQPATTLAADSMPVIDALAAKLSTEIASRHFSTVAVFGAMGPNEVRTTLGSSIGDAMRESLARQTQGFRVVDRDALRSALNQERISATMLDTNIFIVKTSLLVNADCIVMIMLEDFKTSSVNMTSYLFDPMKKDFASLASLTVLLGLHQVESDAIQKAIGFRTRKGVKREDTAAALLPPAASAGEKGVGYPSCVHCPRPDYSPEARTLEIEGEIWLTVLITTDGEATEINVDRALGYGLDDNTIKSILQWKFKPAKDSNGNAVAAWTVIEVQFKVG
ncbi:MAG TPA: energy transducer TonB [Candidatus Acidoferrum sp.]|nr:energy transducer TonB [Candidatus Acidoferrum sp.]